MNKKKKLVFKFFKTTSIECMEIEDFRKMPSKEANSGKNEGLNLQLWKQLAIKPATKTDYKGYMGEDIRLSLILQEIKPWKSNTSSGFIVF